MLEPSPAKPAVSKRPKGALKQLGFTLAELLIVLAIIGILTMVAYPSYQNYAYESRRSDAYAALLQLQLAQENWRSRNNRYTDKIGQGGLKVPAISGEGFYRLSISSASATGYIIMATAIGPQQGDTGCTTLVVIRSQQGESRTPVNCW